jgi:hypothetical protein
MAVTGPEGEAKTEQFQTSAPFLLAVSLVGNKKKQNLTSAYPGTYQENLIKEGHHAMSNKMINKEPKTFVEEFRERLNREDLERRWKLEALDHLFTESEDQPEKFHRLWIKPLMSAGLSLESAFALVVEARFRPN